ncbi:hypothetical protein B0J17DRAFT_637668 [Rhizoctonia solani]|nr:hypothetical protein B0J17DRAFT_637668 [Rhizoctonia solani]
MPSSTLLRVDDAADEGSAIAQPNCSGDNFTTQTHRDPQGNDMSDFDCLSAGGHETLALAYPDFPEKSASSSGAPENYIGFSDGNVHLLVRTQPFLLHEHRLHEFSALEKVIKDARQGQSEPSTSHEPRSRLELSLDEDPEDFANMVEILYLTTCESLFPNDETDKVFKSTLRLETNLGHEDLRSYAIQYLEKRNIPVIERIALANESHVSAWCEGALNELSTWERSIALEEAQILGMDTFVELAGLRQTYKLNAKSKAPSFSKASHRFPKSTRGFIIIRLIPMEQILKIINGRILRTANRQLRLPQEDQLESALEKSLCTGFGWPVIMLELTSALCK